MINFIQKLLNPTVTTIMADFHKAITQLEDLADVERNRVENLFKHAEVVAQEIKDRTEHADKAQAVAAKIKDLVNA